MKIRGILVTLFICAALLLTVNCGERGSRRSIERYNTTYALEVATLNYFLQTNTTQNRVAANTQGHLVEQDRFGRFVPGLAEAWTVNDEQTVWTFTIRPNQYWVDHNGERTDYEITAQDFEAGFRYVSDPANGIRNVRSVLRVIDGLFDYYWTIVDVEDGLIDDITRDEAVSAWSPVGYKATDKYTLEIRLSQPTPFFLSYLPMDIFHPVNTDYLASQGDDFGTANNRLIFSGAYYLSAWDRDSQIIMTKNDHYWDKDSVTVNEVQMQKISDPTIELQMYLRGEITSTLLNADQVLGLRNSPHYDYIHMTDQSSVTFWWHPNYASQNPEFYTFIHNENFRKALFYGIDHENMLSLDDPVNPEGLMRTTIIPEEQCFDEHGMDYTDYPGVREYKVAGSPYDADKAVSYFQKALEELTDGNGNIIGVGAQTINMRPVAEFSIDGKLPMQMLYVHSTDQRSTSEALLFQSMMHDLFGEENIRVELGLYVDSAYREAILTNYYDMMFSSLRFAYADPLAQFDRIVEDGGLLNVGVDSSDRSRGLRDPELRDLIDKAAAQTVLSERYTIFAEVERKMLERAYLMPFRAGGGSYTITNIVPFTMPRGGFGITRFKYKGMQIEETPLTAARVEEIRDEFYKELQALGN